MNIFFHVQGYGVSQCKAYIVDFYQNILEKAKEDDCKTNLSFEIVLENQDRDNIIKIVIDRLNVFESEIGFQPTTYQPIVVYNYSAYRVFADPRWKISPITLSFYTFILRFLYKTSGSKESIFDHNVEKNWDLTGVDLITYKNVWPHYRVIVENWSSIFGDLTPENLIEHWGKRMLYFFHGLGIDEFCASINKKIKTLAWTNALEKYNCLLINI